VIAADRNIDDKIVRAIKAKGRVQVH